MVPKIFAGLPLTLVDIGNVRLPRSSDMDICDWIVWIAFFFGFLELVQA